MARDLRLARPRGRRKCRRRRGTRWLRRDDLAINVESAEAVDDALDEAVAAGGASLKPGTELPFGYGGYFANPDGHAWEVCWNPSFPIAPDGRIEIP